MDKMFPGCGLVMFLCLQCVSAFHIGQTESLKVEYGDSAVLPCNGSAFRDKEGTVHWEAMGLDVAVLQGGEPGVGEHFEGRVLVPSEEQLMEGNWSVVLTQTMLSDSDMYECIWQGGKTISTVWLTVLEPHVERSITVLEGTGVALECYIPTSRTPSEDLEVWWTRNGKSIISMNDSSVFTSELPVSDTFLRSVTKEEIHLLLIPTTSDNGTYQCWYKTRKSETPMPGIPESITLTVLEQMPVDAVFDADEMTTEGRVTTDLETTEMPLDFVPILLEDSTQPLKVVTESQPMEAFQNVAVSTLKEEESSESFQWDTLPWVRIGLLGGVLLLTAGVLCVLGAVRKI